MQQPISFDQLETYLQGAMDEAERSAFERQLEGNANWQQEIEVYKKIRIANQDWGLTELEAKLEDAWAKRQTEAEQPDKGIKYIMVWLRGAVALLVLAVVLFFGWKFLSRTDETPKKIYAQYAQHEFSLREMNNEGELAEIQSLLEAVRYAEALPRLNAYLIEHPEVADVQLAKGIALLETGQPDEALSTFTDLGARHPLYRAESLWYIALTHLKQERVVESVKTLAQIPVSSSRYPAAQQLLHALKKI